MIRFGIIGPGRAASRFAQGLSAVPGTELTAVWGRNPDRARDFAERWGSPVQGCPVQAPLGQVSVASTLDKGCPVQAPLGQVSDVSTRDKGCPVQAPLGRVSVASTLDILFAANIDAVYVATHPDTHAELSIQALAAGKHVLCEKPATLNVRQLEQVLATARRHNRLFMEAMKPPFFPHSPRLRQHLAADPIGPIGFVRAGHCDSTLSPDYPLHFPELGGGGILGIGPYEAFLALDWLGPLKRVQSMGRLSPAGVDNFAVFQTEHDRGMAQLHTGLDLLSRGDALLCGPRGYALIHANWWNPSRAIIHYADRREVQINEPFTHGGFNYEIEHFCQLIREGRRESPEITHALSLGMARLLEAARTPLGVRFPGE